MLPIYLKQTMGNNFTPFTCVYGLEYKVFPKSFWLEYVRDVNYGSRIQGEPMEKLSKSYHGVLGLSGPTS